MTDQAPELLPDKEAHDVIVAYFDSCGLNNAKAGASNILAMLKDAGLVFTRPTPAERPVPQVREALEQEIEKWDTDERFDYPDFEVLESLDRILDALTARPSDAAVAWRYRHKDTEGWSMLKNGRDPTEWLKQWTNTEYEVEALAPMRPEAADEIERLRNQLVCARSALKPFAEIAKELSPNLLGDFKNTMHWAVPTVSELRAALAAITDDQGGK